MGVHANLPGKGPWKGSSLTNLTYLEKGMCFGVFLVICITED